jgi:VWFA-related protein
MKRKKLLILAAFIAIGGGTVSICAQSGRERPSTGTKSNQRPPEPAPSLSPTPLAEAQPESSVAAEDGEVIKVDTQLVTIPVRVMDKKGRFVGGLAKESFKVFEDGVKKEIALFSNEQQPFTVALVLDMSPSSTFKVGEIQSAAIAFIDQLRPQDKVMVISFDEQAHMLCEATNDRKAIYRAIKSTKVANGTSLYEAIDLTINNRMRRIEGRKAVILFTDGVDTTSIRSTAGNNLSDAMELDALIYPIRYDTYADVQNIKNKTMIPPPPILGPASLPGSNPFPIPVPSAGQANSKGTTVEDYERAREYLDQLALRTSGTVYLASTRGDLTESFAKIASELREFYSLGIYPADVKIGKIRKLKVKVDQPGLAVRARDNYVVGKKDTKTK